MFKFGKDKTVPELTVGKQFEPASNNDDMERFCKPTDVAVAKNGDFFVSDGLVIFFVSDGLVIFFVSDGLVIFFLYLDTIVDGISCNRLILQNLTHIIYIIFNINKLYTCA